MFVVDANVTMAWCFEDEVTDDTEAVLDRLRSEQAIVPAIWPLEVANVLLVAERRGRISEAQINRFIRLPGREQTRCSRNRSGLTDSTYCTKICRKNR